MSEKLPRRNIWVALGVAVILVSLIVGGYIDGNAILNIFGVLNG
jgi:hypothetical protein